MASPPRDATGEDAADRPRRGRPRPASVRGDVGRDDDDDVETAEEDANRGASDGAGAADRPRGGPPRPAFVRGDVDRDDYDDVETAEEDANRGASGGAGAADRPRGGPPRPASVRGDVDRNDDDDDVETAEEDANRGVSGGAALRQGGGTPRPATVRGHARLAPGRSVEEEAGDAEAVAHAHPGFMGVAARRAGGGGPPRPVAFLEVANGAGAHLGVLGGVLPRPVAVIRYPASPAPFWPSVRGGAPTYTDAAWGPFLAVHGAGTGNASIGFWGGGGGAVHLPGGWTPVFLATGHGGVPVCLNPALLPAGGPSSPFAVHLGTLLPGGPWRGGGTAHDPHRVGVYQHQRLLASDRAGVPVHFHTNAFHGGADYGGRGVGPASVGGSGYRGVSDNPRPLRAGAPPFHPAGDRDIRRGRIEVGGDARGAVIPAPGVGNADRDQEAERALRGRQGGDVPVPAPAPAPDGNPRGQGAQAQARPAPPARPVPPDRPAPTPEGQGRRARRRAVLSRLAYKGPPEAEDDDGSLIRPPEGEGPNQHTALVVQTNNNLAQTYEAMADLSRSIRQLVDKRKALQEGAKALKDWSSIGDRTRKVEVLIEKLLQDYDGLAEDAERDRHTIRSAGGHPVEPPPYLSTHPRSLI